MFPLPVEVLTVRVRDWVAVCWGEDESVTCTVKANCPVWVVVPESDPAEFTVTPVGSVPEARLQL
jgi:hypothetical protein